MSHAWRDSLVGGGLLELPLRLPGSAEGEQLVVTLRREGEALRSVAIVPGGFMYLRHPGQDGPPPRPVATLSVTEFVLGKARSLASVSGPGLATLRPAARRRLAAVMLTKPCVRRLATPALANTSLIAFLGMAEAPEGVRVRTVRPEPDGRYRAGAGVASRDGSGLALAVGLAERPGCRIEVYGEARSEERCALGRQARATMAEGGATLPRGLRDQPHLRRVPHGNRFAGVEPRRLFRRAALAVLIQLRRDD